MLDTQLQHASDAERQLLKCASVAGLRFTTWAVATMLASDASAFEEMCEALADREQFLTRAGAPQLTRGVPTGASTRSDQRFGPISGAGMALSPSRSPTCWRQ